MVYNDDGIELLCLAIVKNTILDYKNAKKELRKNPKNVISRRTIRECERFLTSEQFSMYSDLDGKELLKRLERKDW